MTTPYLNKLTPAQRMAAYRQNGAVAARRFSRFLALIDANCEGVCRAESQLLDQEESHA